METPRIEYFQLALSGLGFAFTTVCSLIVFLVHREIKRQIARIAVLEQDTERMEDEYKEFRQWVRFIFALTGVITSDSIPTGRKLH